MAKVDLKSLSLQELKSLQARIERELTSRDKRQRKEALSAVKEKAKQLGYKLDELVGDSGPSAKSTATSTTKPKTKRAPAPPKYRSPDDPTVTWSGRGRPPRWINEAKAKGIDLETLRIKADR